MMPKKHAYVNKFKIQNLKKGVFSRKKNPRSPWIFVCETAEKIFKLPFARRLARLQAF